MPSAHWTPPARVGLKYVTPQNKNQRGEQNRSPSILIRVMYYRPARTAVLMRRSSKEKASLDPRRVCAWCVSRRETEKVCSGRHIPSDPLALSVWPGEPGYWPESAVRDFNPRPTWGTSTT